MTLKVQITKVYINFFVQTLSPVENKPNHQNDTLFSVLIKIIFCL